MKCRLRDLYDLAERLCGISTETLVDLTAATTF